MKFRFQGYRVTKSEINLSAENDIDKNLNVEFSDFKTIENGSEYVLEFGMTARNEKKSIEIGVRIRGVFEFDINLSAEEKGAFFYSSAPAILYPYLRAHVSTITAVCGIEPLVLPTINFAAALQPGNNH